MYTIEFKCDYEQSWRYNTVIMCGGYSSSDEQLYVVSTEDIISDIENPIECAPSDYTLPRTMVLEAAEAAHIRTMIYVVPHTLPLGRVVADNPPFEVVVRITKGRKELYRSMHLVNQWGGASIEIKL